MDKTISLHLNKGRTVSGTLRGYDQFMNVVLADAVEEVSSSESKNIGMVVSLENNIFWKFNSFFQVVRGNSIVQVF